MKEIQLVIFKINVNRTPLEADQAQFDFDLSTHAQLPMTELQRIYLKKKYQGKGFAAPLMEAIENRCRTENNSAYLWLGVWSVNLKAIRYYEKQGFERIGEHIFNIGDDAQTDWLMWKCLKIS